MFVLYEKDGIVLAFFIGVHIDAKELLKMIDFSYKSEIKFPQLVMVVLLVSFYCRVNGLIKSNKFLEQYENLQVYWSY